MARGARTAAGAADDRLRDTSLTAYIPSVRNRGVLLVAVVVVAAAVLVALRACDSTTPDDAPAAPPAPVESSHVKTTEGRDTARPRIRAALPGATGDAAAASSTARILRVVSSSGLPVAGVAVRETGVHMREIIARTGPDGEARIDDVTETSRDAASGGAPKVAIVDGREWTPVVLREAVTVVVLSQAAELTVDVIDGRTGAPLAGVRVAVGVGTDEVSSRTVVAGSGERIALPWPFDREVAFTFGVESPPGYAAAGWQRWESTGVFAPRRAHLVIPIHRAVTRTVRLIDANELPVAGAELTRTRILGGGPRGESTDFVSAIAGRSDAQGRIVVEGLPDAPGTRAELSFRRPGRDEGDVHVPELTGVARVPLGAPEADAPPDVFLFANIAGLGAGAGAPFGASRFGARGGFGTSKGATLTFRAFARDGAPAPDVEIRTGRWTGRTDAEGRAEIRVPGDLPAIAVAWGPRFLPTTARVPASPGSEIVLRESPGRRVRVEVVAPDGSPVPAAVVLTESVSFTGADGTEVKETFPIAQFDADGAELLRPLTREGGTIDIEAPAGPFRFRVRVGEVVVETPPYDHPVVRIVVPVER